MKNKKKIIYQLTIIIIFWNVKINKKIDDIIHVQFFIEK